jgi:hypothetical protein
VHANRRKFASLSAVVIVATALGLQPLSVDWSSLTLMPYKAVAKGGGGNGGGGNGGGGGGNGGGKGAGHGGGQGAGASGSGASNSASASAGRQGKTGNQAASTDDDDSNASSLGSLNAAHASQRALDHASSRSVVGQLAAYQSAVLKGDIQQQTRPLPAAPCIKSICDWG